MWSKKIKGGSLLMIISSMVSESKWIDPINIRKASIILRINQRRVTKTKWRNGDLYLWNLQNRLTHLILLLLSVKLNKKIKI
jgi:hypothetical protein